jgi:acylphosphatase
LAKAFITGLDAPQRTWSRLDFPQRVKLTAVLLQEGELQCRQVEAPDFKTNTRKLGLSPGACNAPPCETHSLSATIYRFVSERKQARRYVVSGIVQGVGFRYFTQNAAERLHLSGYTKNLPDGRVEVYAIGTPEQLAKLRSALERGPWGASVSEVREEQATVDQNYANGFVITY